MSSLMTMMYSFDKGKFAGYKIPRGFRLIRINTIFDVKVDGRHKSRIVADGHLITTPSEPVYSGVVSLRGLWTYVFVGELDGMIPWAIDIGNAYLEAVTSEKVCIRAQPEFGELEGHLLIIYKALYELRLSGKLFEQQLQECLRELRFEPLLVASTIYMRKCPTADHYKYVATYVYDLCMIMKDLQSLLNQLMTPPYNFKLKGSGELVFHLGCGFKRNSSGALCIDPGKYVD